MKHTVRVIDLYGKKPCLKSVSTHLRKHHCFSRHYIFFNMHVDFVTFRSLVVNDALLHDYCSNFNQLLLSFYHD